MCFGAHQNATPTGSYVMPAVAPVAATAPTVAADPKAAKTPTDQTNPSPQAPTKGAFTGLNIPTGA